METLAQVVEALQAMTTSINNHGQMLEDFRAEFQGMDGRVCSLEANVGGLQANHVIQTATSSPGSNQIRAVKPDIKLFI